MVHCVLCVERAVISQVPFHIPMTTLSSAECSCSSHHQQAGLLSSTYLFSCARLRSCRNRPAPSFGRMLWKVTKPGFCSFMFIINQSINSINRFICMAAQKLDWNMTSYGRFFCSVICKVNRWIFIALYTYKPFISKTLRCGPCVTMGSHSFTCHPQTNHTCLYSPTARHHRPLAGTYCTYPWRVGQAELTWVASHIPR